MSRIKILCHNVWEDTREWRKSHTIVFLSGALCSLVLVCLVLFLLAIMSLLTHQPLFSGANWVAAMIFVVAACITHRSMKYIIRGLAYLWRKWKETAKPKDDDAKA